MSSLNPSSLFIMRPVATILLTFGVAAAGAVAYFQLPVAPLPNVDFPVISVTAQLPGASPAVVATTVATPAKKPTPVSATIPLNPENIIPRCEVCVLFGESSFLQS